MLSVALAGYSQGQTMKENTDILDQLNLSVLTVIIIAAAAMTVFTSLLGLAGAYFRSMIVLKLVSRATDTQRRRQTLRRCDTQCRFAFVCFSLCSTSC
jgi:hypothetical protein